MQFHLQAGNTPSEGMIFGPWSLQAKELCPTLLIGPSMDMMPMNHRLWIPSKTLPWMWRWVAQYGHKVWVILYGVWILASHDFVSYITDKFGNFWTNSHSLRIHYIIIYHIFNHGSNPGQLISVQFFTIGPGITRQWRPHGMDVLMNSEKWMSDWRNYSLFLLALHAHVLNFKMMGKPNWWNRSVANKREKKLIKK